MLVASSAACVIDNVSNWEAHGVKPIFRVVGVGFFIVAPLFQTNFLPELMQVKVLLPTADLMPSFVHLSPALTAALTGVKGRDKESTDKNATSFNFTI